MSENSHWPGFFDDGPRANSSQTWILSKITGKAGELAYYHDHRLLHCKIEHVLAAAFAAAEPVVAADAVAVVAA